MVSGPFIKSNKFPYKNKIKKLHTNKSKKSINIYLSNNPNKFRPFIY